MGGGGVSLLDSQISTPKDGDNKTEDGEEYVVTYKTYDDYFIDYELTADKMTEKDFTGTGTSSNPFNVYSTRGFIYLSTKFNGRYTNLHCDIILNDETFDENGTPSGGDGVVYEWSGDINGYQATLNGNGFSIKGLYFASTGIFLGLFDTPIVSLIENVKMEGFYVKGGDYVSPFGYRVLRMANCVSNGFVRGAYGISGFAINIVENAKNCVNYSNIKNIEKEDGLMYDRAGGCFVFVTNGAVVENCHNYGDVLTRWYGGGIIGEYHNLKGTLKNCNNYGNIKGLNAVGGIVSALYQGELNLINCNNYGTLGETNTTVIGNLGGIVGFVGGTISISGCMSYGKILRSNVGMSCGGIVGAIGNGPTGITGSVYIDDCYAEVDCKTLKESSALVGRLAGSEAELIVKNSNFKITNFESSSSPNTLGLITNPKLLSLENIEFEVFANDMNAEREFYIVSKSTGVNIISSNILVKANFKVKNDNLFRDTDEDCCKNYIISSNGAKCYGGSNFGNFYYSWKQGEVVLGGLSGNSFFQNKIDEDWLQRNGYTKKEVD